MPGRKRAHYRGDYAARSAAVRAAAYRNPTTTCWRCGLTLDEKRQTHPKVTWDAGHVVDGAVGGLLLPEHSSCNRSAGAASGYSPPRSRKWTNY